MRRCGLIIVVSVLLIVLTVSGQDGLALMKVEAGARPAGMGGAFVAISGDAMSPIYNPAGAAGSPPFVFGFGHHAYWDNVRIETGYAVGNPSNKLFVFGGIRFAAVSDLEARVLPSEEPTGLFDAHDVSFKTGAAYQVTDKLALGAAVGWFVEKIDIYQGTAFNTDFGLNYLIRSGLNFGLSATNLGGEFYLKQNSRAESDAISVPTTYRAGLAYEYSYLLGALDLVVVDDKSHVHLGAEYEASQNFAVRAGYMSGYDTKNIAAGASFKMPMYKVVIDYAFVPYTDNLGTTHQFNLSLGL